MIRPSDIDGGFRLDLAIAPWLDRPAMEMGERVITYRELPRLVNLTCDMLEKNGCREGHWVAIHDENSELHPLLLLACWAMKCVFVPMDPRSPLTKLMGQVPMDLLVTAGRVLPGKNMAMDPALFFDEYRSGAAPSRDRLHITVNPGQDSLIIYTSGSTGSPKGVLHTAGSCLYSALGTAEHLEMDEKDRWLASLPMNHVGGLLIALRTLITGAALVFPEPLSLEEALAVKRPSIMSLVPTQLMRLMKSEKNLAAMKNMKAILLGGAPAPGWLIDSALEAGLPVIPSYGSTEACSNATAVKKNSDRTVYHTSGRPLPYREVSIDHEGRIIVHGKTLFRGYVGEGRDVTATGAGGFRTSDLGMFDHGGNLVVLGRSDQVFISGGENINPQEIEHELRMMENIMDAAVVPVPHEEYGMVPWAFVDADAEIDEEDMKRVLRNNLPGFKVPKRIIAMDKSGDGSRKYDRKGLMDLALAMSRGDA